MKGGSTVVLSSFFYLPFIILLSFRCRVSAIFFLLVNVSLGRKSGFIFTQKKPPQQCDDFSKVNVQPNLL